MSSSVRARIFPALHKIDDIFTGEATMAHHITSHPRYFPLHNSEDRSICILIKSVRCSRQGERAACREWHAALQFAEADPDDRKNHSCRQQDDSEDGSSTIPNVGSSSLISMPRRVAP